MVAPFMDYVYSKISEKVFHLFIQILMALPVIKNLGLNPFGDGVFRQGIYENQKQWTLENDV